MTSFQYDKAEKTVFIRCDAGDWTVGLCFGGLCFSKARWCPGACDLHRQHSDDVRKHREAVQDESEIREQLSGGAGYPFLAAVNRIEYAEERLVRAALLVYLRVVGTAQNVVNAHMIKISQNDEGFCWRNTFAIFEFG